MATSAKRLHGPDACIVEVAETITKRAPSAHQSRDSYIQLCSNHEQEFAALIPKDPDWEAL